VTTPASGDSVSADVQGTIEGGYSALLGETECTTIAIEYGTLPAEQVLQALRADNWLYLHGDVTSPEGQVIKSEVRAAFYGEDSQWTSDVWQRGLDIARKTIAGLADS
jgi:hypothetical protein